MDIDSALARPSRLGAATALGTALGILTLCLVFQFVVPALNGLGRGAVVQENLNFRSLILYATAGGIHILLCSGSMVFFWEQLRRGESQLEFRHIVMFAAAVFAIIVSIVLIACYLNINVVGQSYQERVMPLQGDWRLAFLLTKRAFLFTSLKLELLALFPLALVLFGVAAAVMACFWISHRAIAFAHRADDLKKSDILVLKRNLTQLISIVTVVFTTSTIATIALMQIGRDWIEKGSVRDAYIQNGHAMSIFWSACYTTVIVLMIVLPLWWIARRTRRIQRQAKHAGGRTSFYDQILEVLSYKSIVQAGSVTLAPLFTSSIAAVLGS